MSHLIRWGGLAGLVAGVMFLLAGILVLIAPPQRAFNSFGDHLIEVILVVAFALTLVARAFMLYKVGATAHWEQQAPY